MIIKDLLIRQRNNDNIAVEYSNKEYSYSDIYDTVIFEISCIKQMNSCNNVGIFMQNSIQYVVGYFVITFLGKVIVPIEINLKEFQLKSVISYCELNYIITNNSNIEKLKKMLSTFEHYDVVVYNIDTGFEEYLSGVGKMYMSEEIRTSVDEQSIAIMLHTSGTTSNPKKVMLTHKNLITNIVSNISVMKYDSSEKSLIVLPMYFGYCHSSQFLTHFYLGATIVIYEGQFNPAKFLQYIDDKGCTNTTCVPSMLFLVIKMSRKKYILSSLRYLCFGGGVMPIEKLYKIIDFFNHTGIVQTYGQTEASPRLTALMPGDALRKIGSVGKAIPGVNLRVVDDNDVDVNVGQIGQIIAKGDNVMKGYYKCPEVTEITLKNGWLHTGDLGRFDQENYLYIVGRLKNMLICGGINVYPEEIEELLISHPAVKEAVVIGQKHKLLGEIPIAKVVLNQDFIVTKSELQRYCSRHLEEHKIPAEIVITDNLEKTYTGKIKR